MRNDHVLSVAELVNLLRFGDWMIQVGMVMQKHVARKVLLERAWLDEGSLHLELRSKGEQPAKSDEAYPLESLMVIRSGHRFAPVYTLRGDVNVTISGPKGTRKAVRRNRALAAFQRVKVRKNGKQHAKAAAKCAGWR